MDFNNGLILIFGNVTTPSNRGIVVTLPISLSNANYNILTGLYDLSSPHDGHCAIAGWDYRTINSFFIEGSYSGTLYASIISYLIVGN